MRTHQPPYPRPVPDIDFDEIELFPDTVIYTGNNDSNMEEDDEARATKRRRIEDAAHAYLRGQDLYIMSARLKGPLNSTWQNPWNQYRSTLSNQVNRKPNRTTTNLHRSGVKEQTISGRKIDTVGSLRRREVVLDQPPRKASLAHGEDIERRNSDQKVQAWLHRNEMVDKEAIEASSQPLGSPTPSGKAEPYKDTEISSPPRKQTTPAHPISPTASLSVVKPAAKHIRSRKKPLVSHSRLQNVLRQDKVQRAESQDRQDHQFSDVDEPHSQARAEVAILRMKGKKGDPVPAENVDTYAEQHPSANDPVHATQEDLVENAFSQMTPENSQSSQDQFDEKKLKSQPGDKDNRDNIPDHPGPEKGDSQLIVGHDAHSQRDDELAAVKTQTQLRRSSRLKNGHDTQGQMPPPPTVRSEPSTAELLPSAQRQPDVAVSNSHLFEEVKPIELTASHDEVFQAQNSNVQDAVVQREEKPKPSNIDSQHLDIPDLTDETPKPPKRSKIAFESLNSNKMPTPRQIKVEKKAKRKQASFVADVEQRQFDGSIKNSLKVGKSMTTIEPVLQKRKMLEMQEPDENVMSQDSQVRKHSMNVSFQEEPAKCKPARSILKNSNVSSTLHPSHQRGQSSIFLQREQEQRQAEQDGQNKDMNDNEPFDLDGAIDDLGSFLSTWDAEKEASQMIVH